MMEHYLSRNADATGLSVEESKELHKLADKDDDGKMSLSEFVASPAEKVAANLPEPVAPVRKPVNRTEPKPSQQQNFQPQSLTPQPVVKSQSINQRPPQIPQQQMWNLDTANNRSSEIVETVELVLTHLAFLSVCGSQNLN